MPKKFFFLLSLFLCAYLISTSNVRAESLFQIAIVNPLQLIPEDKSINGMRINVVYGFNENVSGLDVGLVNRTFGQQTGLQVGLFNSTFEMEGVQIGIINRADFLSGVQIGLVNFHDQSDAPYIPLIRVAF